MLQQRQIVKSLGKHIDTEDPAFKVCYHKFHSIAWMIISVNVTIYRTIVLSESYENNHCITTTRRLRRCI
jgi:hypothetical protein